MIETLVQLKSEISQVTVEFLKFLTGLAWPIAGVFIAKYFSSDIRNLMGRTSKATLTGVEFSPPQAQADQQQKANDDKTLTSESSTKSENFPKGKIIDIMEKQINLSLQHVNNNDREKWLISNLAQAKIQVHFEQSYNAIFGSQIVFLKKLNSSAYITLNQAKEFFVTYTSNFSKFYEIAGFEGWLKFLEFQEFIHLDNDLIYITDIGREFLIYLSIARKSEEKPW